MVAGYWPIGPGADSPALAVEEMKPLQVNIDPDLSPHGPVPGGIEPDQEMPAAVLAGTLQTSRPLTSAVPARPVALQDPANAPSGSARRGRFQASWPRA